MVRMKFISTRWFLLLLLLSAGALGFQLAKEVGNRYNIETEISTLEQSVLDLEKGNQELTDLIGYLKTPSFQEREVRQKLNLQKPGEFVVVLPEETTVPTDEKAVSVSISRAGNLLKWWDYFFKNE